MSSVEALDLSCRERVSLTRQLFVFKKELLPPLRPLGKGKSPLVNSPAPDGVGRAVVQVEAGVGRLQHGTWTFPVADLLLLPAFLSLLVNYCRSRALVMPSTTSTILS